MDARWLAAAVCVACASCAGRGHTELPVAPPPTGDVLELHRDLALVEQRVIVHAKAAGEQTITVELPPRVQIPEIRPADLDGIELLDIHAADAADGSGKPDDNGWQQAQQELDDTDESDNENPLAPGSGRGILVAVPSPPKPTTVELQLKVPRAGELSFGLVYAINDLQWDASYELTTTASRRSAHARGAIAIRNATGIVFHASRVAVVDDEVSDRRDEALKALTARTLGADAGDPLKHPAAAHELGAFDVGDGEIRVELYRPDATRALRSLLVFDPFDPKLDVRLPMPERRVAYDEPTTTEVTDRVEIERTDDDLGLPGGPATLLERKPDGSVVAIARGTMFGTDARVGTFDSLALDVAPDVTAKRVRRDYSLDDDRRRITEEFAIEIDNQRGQPVEVAALEHLYRGQSWSLGYWSTTVAQTGPQVIALRGEVPAHGKQSMMYVVVYTWDDEQS